MRLFRALWLLLALTGSALSVGPGEALSDPALEARARAISAELRCLVCQNQSIDDSDAELAGQLRQIVRERLVAGDSDGEVKQYLVDRYGEFVLLRPVLGWHTLLLWGIGPLLLAAGLGLLIYFGSRRGRPAEVTAVPDALTPEEQTALSRLVAGPMDPRA